jgi:hypothetical protein
MNCKFCGAPLPAEAHGKREYCNNAHKQAHYRQQLQQEQREKAELVAEIDRLKEKVADQEEEIAQHREVIRDLKYQLNLEWRYLMDMQARGFIAFLKKQPPTPFIEKILANRFFVFHSQASRATYEGMLYRMNCTREEHEEFKTLWKLLMLTTYSEDF